MEQETTTGKAGRGGGRQECQVRDSWHANLPVYCILHCTVRVPAITLPLSSQTRRGEGGKSNQKVVCFMRHMADR